MSLEKEPPSAGCPQQFVAEEVEIVDLEGHAVHGDGRDAGSDQAQLLVGREFSAVREVRPRDQPHANGLVTRAQQMQSRDQRIWKHPHSSGSAMQKTARHNACLVAAHEHAVANQLTPHLEAPMLQPGCGKQKDDLACGKEAAAPRRDPWISEERKWMAH